MTPSSLLPLVLALMAINRRLRFKIFARDKFTCQYCGRKPPEVELQVDHKFPRAKGGDDKETNLVTACVECNGGKHTSTVPIVYTCVGGPYEGVEVPRLDEAPVEWVWKSPRGHRVILSDAIDTEFSEESPYWRVIYGPHQWQRPESAELTYFLEQMKRGDDEPRAELLGAYVSVGYRAYPLTVSTD